jgi:GDP-mannose 6-dehydrogenase
VHGANRDYINQKIPHVSSLLNSDLNAVIEHAEVMIVGNRDSQFAKALANVNGSRPTLDLVGFMSGVSHGHTQGICW